MSNLIAYFTDLMTTLGSSTLYWIAGGLLALLLVLWLIYRTVKSAVRAAIRDSGMAMPAPQMMRSRRAQLPKHDFVYTEPRSEH